MQMSCIRISIQCVLLLLSAVGVMLAQSSSASLSGTVADPSGGVLAGALVQVERPATGAKLETTTGSDGSFTFPILAPGTYRISASQPGFNKGQIDALDLNVNDRRQINIKLELAPRQDTLVVLENYTNLQEAATVATVVDQKFVENLPLNGRSFQNLISLTPGVLQTTATARNPGQFAINGQRTSSNYFTVDGVSANFGVMASPQFSPATDGVMPALSAAGGTSGLISVDAMQEFQIQTSTFAPEFGRTPGGQIAILSRTGGNELHGSLFEFFRNEKLDANDWFANREGLGRAPVRQNDFGGTLGGPVWIPRLYDGRNKTFFFASYEALRLRQPQFAQDAYPSLVSRARATPANRPLLDAYPIPNREDIGGGFGRFVTTYSNPLNVNSTSVRVDHNIGNRVTLFGRYHDSPSRAEIRGPIQSYDLALNVVNLNRSNNRTFTAGSTQTFTPRLTNEVRFNWSRNVGEFSTRMDGLGGAIVPAQSFLFPSFATPENASVGILPVGVKGWAQGVLAANRQSQINVVDNFAIVTGAHQIKFGVDFRRLDPEVAAPVYQQFGVFAGLEGPVGLISGRTAAALVGAFDGVRAEVRNFSWYAQDTWRPRPGLSITFGLRWEYNPPPAGLDGKTIYTALGIDNPRTATLAPAGTPLFETKKNAFAPRFGISYLLRDSVNWSTTVRGGYGLFYDLPLGGLQAATGNPPYRRNVRAGGVPYPLPPNLATPPPPTTQGRFDAIYGFAQDFSLPYAHQFNFALEQGLGRNRTFSATYGGALGRNLLRRETFSQPGAFQTFDTVQIQRSDAASDYHSLQLQFIERLNKNLQVLVSYTWSHSIDTASDNVSLTLPDTLFDPRLNRASSDFDVRHVVSGAVTYDLPFGRGEGFFNHLARDWGMDGVFRVQSGFPIDILQRRATLVGNYDLRPNLVPGQPLEIFGDAYPGGRILNRAAFQSAATQQVHGTMPRNFLRGFPLEQLDLTVRRTFRFGERWNAQLRGEFFNVLNHPSFGAPVSNLADPLFGRSTQMYGRGLGLGGVNGGQNPLYAPGTARSIQLALRLRW